MAKKTTTGAPSWTDFTEGTVLDPIELEEEQENEEEEEEEVEEEEEEKKPKKGKKKVKEEEEQEEEVEEEEEEEEEPAPIKKKAPKEEEEETEEEEEEKESTPAEEAEKFFTEVEKLTGTEIDVDYGDIDPLSPQGIALREKAVKEAALDSWLEEIKEKFPKVFQALVHANNGGDVAELFTQTTTRDYSKVTLKEEDTDLAKEILREYYKSKGVKSETRITKLIETDEDSDNGLVEEAKSALEELKAEQEESRQAILDAQKEQADAQKKRDGVLLTAVDEVLTSRNLGGFKLTDKQEASQFRQYVLSNLRRTGDGKYELATPVNEKELEKILQYQYFQFKKGDLSKIIQQKAVTETTKRLRLKLQSEQEKVKKNNTESSRTIPTLRDFTS